MVNDVCLTLRVYVFLQTTVPRVVLISFRWKFQLKNILRYLVHLALLFIVVVLILIPILVLVILGRKVIVACLFNYVKTFLKYEF